MACLLSNLFYFVWLFGKFFIYYLVSFYSLTLLSVGFLLSVSSCLLIVGRFRVVGLLLSVFYCRFSIVGLLLSDCVVGFSLSVGLLLSVFYCRFFVVGLRFLVGFALSVGFSSISCCRFPV